MQRANRGFTLTLYAIYHPQFISLPRSPGVPPPRVYVPLCRGRRPGASPAPGRRACCCARGRAAHARVRMRCYLWLIRGARRGSYGTRVHPSRRMKHHRLRVSPPPSRRPIHRTSGDPLKTTSVHPTPPAPTTHMPQPTCHIGGYSPGPTDIDTAHRCTPTRNLAAPAEHGRQPSDGAALDLAQL